MSSRSPWQPRLSEPSHGSVYERLAQAMRESIAARELAPGDRMPSHREIATHLGIATATVSKAFSRLIDEGHLSAVHGSGTFVSDFAQPSQRDAVIDLSMNVPPPNLGMGLLSRSLARIPQAFTGQSLARYTDVAGHERHREAFAHWLTWQGVQASRDTVLLSHGAQHAISLALLAASGPGAIVCTEAVTYSGALTAIRLNRQTAQPIAVDRYGMLPGALDRALGAAVRTTQARPIVYVTPTLHNPTGATMSPARRVEIVRVCREHDAVIIEDDVYSLFRPRGTVPLQSLAPERTWYVNSFSKSLSPSLRLGVLVIPKGEGEQVRLGLEASTAAVSPIIAELVAGWIADGTVGNVGLAMRAEAEERLQVAERIIGSHIERLPESGFHVWLPMARASAQLVLVEAARAGVLVTAPSTLETEREPERSGIRLCLGAASPEQLERALQALTTVLARALPA